MTPLEPPGGMTIDVGIGANAGSVVRILREEDAGESILDVYREHNISEVSFHRWKEPWTTFGGQGNAVQATGGANGNCSNN